MLDEPLLPSAFIRRIQFMLRPLRYPRYLPNPLEERTALTKTAREWLAQFVVLATEMREWLLSRVLNPASSTKMLTLPFLQATAEPISGWDFSHDSEDLPVTERLFDPETIERIIYLIEQLTEDAKQAFFQELALLAIDRLDLLLSLLRAEYTRLENL